MASDELIIFNINFVRSLGFREVQITVYLCYKYCRECNGPLNTNCTSCYPSFI